MSKICILLADDHQMFRTGIANLLKREDGFEICGEASDGNEAVRLVKQSAPDVVLMDIHLPILNGIAATKIILADNPSVKILALTSYEDEEYVLDMVKAGATGYILKDAPVEELVLAIKTIASGNFYFAKEVSPILIAHLDRPGPASKLAPKLSVTGRELEVLQHIAAELTNKEIGAKLFISPRTVETHRRNLIQKLKVKNTAGLVKFYLNMQGLEKGELRAGG